MRGGGIDNDVDGQIRSTKESPNSVLVSASALRDTIAAGSI
jgi:hypothetical protein